MYFTLPTYFPGGRGRKRGEWRKIKRSRQQKQQNNKQHQHQQAGRYLLPFSRITVSVAWYIYLTVLKCICNVGLKKNHQSINKIIVPYPPPTCTFTNTLTLPYLTLHSVFTLSIPPQQHLPIPDHLFSLSLTISGLSPPTYLPYRTQVYLAFMSCPAFPFPLPALLYIHTYILSFPPAQPTSR